MVTRIQERLVPLARLAVLAAGTTLSGHQQALPASDDSGRRGRLNASPRHGEWVKIQSGGDTINA